MFKKFADAVNVKFLEMSKTGVLLKTNVSKEQAWKTYQDSFEPKDNPIFRERRVHECNTCYNFIKRLGAVVTVVDDKLDSIWNVDGLPEPYNTVAKNMHNLVTGANISSPFLTDEKLAGKEYNIEENEAGNIRWDHFYADIDQAFISQNVATTIGEIESTVKVFNRALQEFSIETLESVIDLCDSIYRGEEFKPTVEKFLQAKRVYESSNQSIFIWTQYKKYPAKIRNSAIGTLIIDVQNGVDLEEAVKKYEAVVAPENYKRTTAVVTEGMKKQAVEKIDELGLRDSLPRRHATLTDISVNDILFANADAQAEMKDSLDELLDSVSTKTTDTPKSAIEINIEQFLEKIKTDKPSNIELLVENKLTPNFVSLVAPVNPEAPNMLKWANNFSWSYAGEVTDAMKERVKAAGGSITGDVRFSIQWNESGMDGKNDLDAHCNSPKSHIYYSQKKGMCGGQLDVDIQNPNSQTKDGTAVENITWQDIKSMPDGEYKFKVHNYAGLNTNGFRAQIEILGELFEYDYSQSVRNDIVVAIIIVKNGKATIEHHLSCSTAQKTEWSIDTKQYHKVSTIMLSPNHWDGQSIGNKHYFFMLEGCQNPDAVRGFYNEFLSNELTPNRKFFEILSSKMKCQPTKDQLSGIGFSSTLRNECFVKVDGKPYQIKF